MSASSGNLATWKALLAGKSLEKKVAYTSFTAVKSFKSLKKTVALMILSSPEPASSSTAAKFLKACSACFVAPSANYPVAGLIPS